MKALRTIILSAASGALAAMLVERVFGQRSAGDMPAARHSRSVAEIAPSFRTLERDFTGDLRPYHAHREAWIMFVREAVRPGLTELEANQIAQAILEYEPPAYNYAPSSASMHLWENGFDEGEDSR